MVLGACGTGSETRTSTPSAQFDRTRNAALPTGLVRAFSTKGLGSGLVAGMAMNAIGVGLAAIPGMPKEVAAIFGGGGADNAEVLKAIAELKEMIENLDKKVDELQASLDKLTSNVAALSEKVDMVAQNLCGLETAVKTAPLKEVMTFVESDWRDLFGDEGAARLTVAHTVANDTKNAMGDEKALLDIYSKISKNYKFKYTQAIFTETLLSKEGQRGLIAQMQACTLAKKRYITTQDTALWKVFVDNLIHSQLRALQVEVFIIGYESYIEAKNAATAAGVAFDKDSVTVNTRAINRVVTEFIASASASYAMVEAQIPTGLVLDTVTQKMWSASNRTWATTLADAMKSCVNSGSSSSANVQSLTGVTSVAINPCASNTGLDGEGVASDRWRIPHLWELSNYSLVNQKTAWYNSSLGGGLIDGGSNGVAGFSNADGSNNCGPNGASGTPCTTPSEYLASLGASALTTGLSSDTSAIWSTTSYAATYQPAGVSASRNAATNPKLKTVNDVFKSTNNLNSVAPTRAGYSVVIGSGGWRSGTWEQTAIYNTCLKEVETRLNEKAIGCLTLYDDDTMNDRCYQLKDNKPVLHGLAQVHVVNIGKMVRNTAIIPAGAGNQAYPANYNDLKPAGTGRYFASQSEVGHQFLCQTYWKKWTGDWGTDVHFRNYLPERASVLLVRDLQPNEHYYWLDGKDNLAKSWAVRAKFEKPVINALTSESDIRFDSFSLFNNTLEVRCLITAESAPEPAGWDQLDSKCQRATNIPLTAGKYRATYMALDTKTGVKTNVQKLSFSLAGPAPLLPTRIEYSVEVGSILARIIDKQSHFSYTLKVKNSNGETATCEFAQSLNFCGLVGLKSGVASTASITVRSGLRSKESAPYSFTPLSPPTTTTTSTTSTTVAPPATPVVAKVFAGDGKIEIAVQPTEDTTIQKHIVRFAGSGKFACQIEQSATNCFVPQLTNGIQYSFTVTAVSARGLSAPSEPTKPVTPIATPLAPTVVFASADKSTLTVGVSSSSASAAVDKYAITVSDGSQSLECVALADSPKCVLDVTRGVNYLISAVAINSSGRSEAKSINYFVPDVPAAPVITEASAADASLYVELDTSTIDDSVQKFTAVASPGNKTCTIELPATGCSLPAVNGTSYVVSVVAVSKTGEKSKVAKTAALTPAAPEKIQAAVATKALPTQAVVEAVVPKLEEQPAPKAAEVPANEPMLKVKGTLSVAAVRKALGGDFVKAKKISLKARAASKNICAANAKGVTGKKAGFCVVNVTATITVGGKAAKRTRPFVVAVVS